MLAPELSQFGDGSHDYGATGLTVDGGGFGAFPGQLWIYENSDRTGNADQLTVGPWNDIELTGVEIPASPNNAAGVRYLFLLREDLAWSNALAFSLVDPGAPATVPKEVIIQTTRRRLLIESTKRPTLIEFSGV